ncbi:MAG TPA: universal stress protein [Thermoplasmatales archaeon]|nr:universal stress protein [Thermoplasmatales archaeon]
MKKLLVAYDGSEASKKAVELSIKLVGKEDTIILITVIPGELLESSFTKMLLPTIDLSSIVKPGTFKERAMEELSEVAEKLKPYAKEVNIDVESGDPADEILLSAKKHQVDIIVLGYKGYGKEGRFLLGSVTDKIVRYASVSVLVVR